ncbi:MAG: Uma2 family endonuclease [Chloroflexi bacterium]|nr:Uma2 family endonuclease [Chloroflexota bacterium]MCC6892815.1 Uma2 family endonuclease [Anaerolineae bacterium]
MVLQTHQPIKTVDDFIRYATLPENADRNLEYINGKVVEKLGSTTQNSQIPMLLSAVVVTHCDTHNVPCYLTGADGEYCIADGCFIPDFAYKQTPVSSTFPDTVPPLWAVEVISANENPAAKRRKYIQAGILLWEVYPDERVIDVYAAGQSLATYGTGSRIPVSVIAGLQVDVSKLFR